MFDTFAWRVLDWQTLVLDLADSRSPLEVTPSKETEVKKGQAACKNALAKSRKTIRKKLKLSGTTPPPKRAAAVRGGPSQVASAQPGSVDPSRIPSDSVGDTIVLPAKSSPRGAPTAIFSAAHMLPNTSANPSASLSSAAWAKEESFLRPSTRNGSLQNYEHGLEWQVAELRQRLIERLSGSRKHHSATERAGLWMPSVEQLQLEDAALSRAKALEARIVEELAQLREVRARFA